MKLKSKRWDFTQRLIKLNPKISAAQVAKRLKLMGEFERLYRC